MIVKVRDFVKENNMISKNNKVLVALSGGPDSICLIHILNELKEELGIEVMAAHLNHCLRGEDANKDEEYVREFCRDLEIPCYIKRVDINSYAKEKALSSEMAGREARYEFFNELKEEFNINKIAVAHNSNDQAETVLMRLMRGTGIEGLMGIRPVREDIYIRPILSLSRYEIEKYCEDNKLSPRIDKTNLETIYSRNKVRLELIPYIEKNFNEDIINTLNRFSQTLSVDNDYIQSICENKFSVFCSLKDNRVIIKKEAFNEHEAIITRIIRKAIEKLKGSIYNIERVHIYDIISLSTQETGKSINLPLNLIANNTYGDVVIGFNKNKEKLKNESIYKEITHLDKDELLKGIVLKEKFLNYKVELRLVGSNEVIDFKSSNFIKYFSIPSLDFNIKVRGRCDGDKFTPYGMKGSKKLKDLFINLKVNREDRDKIPLLLINNNIGWIVGYRVSEKFKINKNSKYILEVKFESEE